MSNSHKAHFKQRMACVSLWMKHLPTTEEGVFLFVYGCCQKQLVFSGMLKSNAPLEHLCDPHLLTCRKKIISKKTLTLAHCVFMKCDKSGVLCRRQPNNLQAKLAMSKSPAGWSFGIIGRWSGDKSMQATHMLVNQEKNTSNSTRNLCAYCKAWIWSRFIVTVVHVFLK